MQTIKPNVQQERLRVGQQATGQVAWVKCRVPLSIDQSDTPVLFEPDEKSMPLQQLDMGEGWLEIQDPRRPYVAVLVGNNTKLSIHLPRKTALVSIQPIQKVVETDS